MRSTASPIRIATTKLAAGDPTYSGRIGDRYEGPSMLSVPALIAIIAASPEGLAEVMLIVAVALVAGAYLRATATVSALAPRSTMISAGFSPYARGREPMVRSRTVFAPQDRKLASESLRERMP